MWTCSASPISGHEIGIQITHGEDTFTVDKLKLALFSDFVRENFDRVKGPIKIHDNIGNEAVGQFVKLIQEGKYEITKENAFDLLRISCEISISSIFNDLICYIEDNFTLDEIISLAAAKGANTQFFNGISVLLAHKLDSAMLVPDFANLGVDKLSKILSSEEAVYSDHHLLFSFIMEQVEKNKEKAAPLLAAIDMQRLSQKEAEKLMSNSFLFSNEEEEVVASDIESINTKIVNIRARVSGIKGNGSPMNDLDERFKDIHGVIDVIGKEIEDCDDATYKKLNNLKDKLGNSKRRTKNDSRRLTADLKTIQGKLKSLKTKVQKEFPVE